VVRFCHRLGAPGADSSESNHLLNAKPASSGRTSTSARPWAFAAISASRKPSTMQCSQAPYKYTKKSPLKSGASGAPEPGEPSPSLIWLRKRPAGNPSRVFIRQLPKTGADRTSVAITCQVKTRICPYGVSGQRALRGFLDVDQVGFDHAQVSLAGLPDDVQQAIHLHDLFELLVDDPLQKDLPEVIVLLHGEIDEAGVLARPVLSPGRAAILSVHPARDLRAGRTGLAHPLLSRSGSSETLPESMPGSTASTNYSLYASGTGRSGRSNQSGRRVPSGPGAGRVIASHS